ncbi:MAG: hypothetical protein LBJ71_04505 [Holosporaceae bacterium]|jgi:hypothetical protein|nr:hypothetical protein [Holosporaceae bacterium]
MVRYIFLSAFMFVELSALDFFDAVQQYADNPAVLVKELQKIRTEDVRANAFLCTFGGKDFAPESDEEGQRTFNEQINTGLVEAALCIGSEMRKKGARKLDNIDDLLIAKRFLVFVAESGTGSTFFDNGTIIGQLDGMLEHRRNYIDAVSLLEQQMHERQHEPYDHSPIDDSLLDDL